MKEKPQIKARLDKVEEDVKDCKNKLNGFQLNFKRQMTSPSKVYNNNGGD